MPGLLMLKSLVVRGLFRKFSIIFGMIRFEHTVFALPFAYMGSVLAAHGFPAPDRLAWITLAMVGGRSAGMTFNRIIDRKIGAENPRTPRRAIPSGLVSLREAYAFALGSLALYFFSAYQLNMLCFVLSPIPAILFVLYHFTKRYTWFCHLVLGSVLGLAPIGGWIAITGSFAIPPLVVGLAVALWVAGFDMVYACADVKFDRAKGLYSVPRAFGIEATLQASRLLHAATVLLLAAAGLLLHLGALYWIGILASAAVLSYEHLLVMRRGLGSMGERFLNVNGAVSISMLASAILGVSL